MTNADNICGTMFISDNLPFLKALDSESIDLVCIDPPFGKKQTFTGRLTPPLRMAEQDSESELMDNWGVYDAATAYEMGLEWPDQSGKTAKFSDIWNFPQKVTQDWYQGLEQTNPALYLLLESTRYSQDDGTAAYIVFMAERMMQIRRVLKPSGSVYLHCDYEANAYIRQMMDAVFGKKQFRGEIIWHRSAENLSRKKWRRASETLFYYSKTRNPTWHQQFTPLDVEQTDRDYRHKDEHGRYTTTSCTNNAHRPNMIYEFNGNVRQWRFAKETMLKFEREGLLVYNDDGIPRRKRYLGEVKGKGMTRVC